MVGTKDPVAELRKRISKREATIAKLENERSQVQGDDRPASVTRDYYDGMIRHRREQLTALKEQLADLGG